MCRLFDVKLLWIHEVTLYFYVISAVGAKLAVKRRKGFDASDVLTFTQPPRKVQCRALGFVTNGFV